MNKTILFSPVGGTDPIPTTNLKDGSLLHICRVYKPDEVYLYMSKEIYANHLADNRYIYCLDKLYEMLEKEYTYNIEIDEEMENVQDFNVFYDKFRIILSKITEKMDDTDKLIINVSSGTPAMKSGLLVIKTLGELECEMIQVVTPTGSMNEHRHKDFDLSVWELNDDNTPDFENRCRVISCPNLSYMKYNEIIKNLVKNYDYDSAIEIAKTMPNDITAPYFRLLELANRRLMLDQNSVRNISKELGVDFFAVKKTEYISIFEYSLSWMIKYKKGQYDDFIRGLTPLFVRVLEAYVEKCEGVKIRDFCDDKGKWLENELRQSPVGRRWLSSFIKTYGSNFRFDYVNSDSLLAIIKADDFGKDSTYTVLQLQSIQIKCEKIRNIESSIRNPVAHEITAITPERFRNLTKLSFEEMATGCKNLITSVIGAKSEDWSSYDSMNEYIISKIGI